MMNLGGLRMGPPLDAVLQALPARVARELLILINLLIILVRFEILQTSLCFRIYFDNK